MPQDSSAQDWEHVAGNLATVRARIAAAAEAAGRDMVTSPGGTTAEGLRAMEEKGVRAGTMEAIIAAYRRTRELGEA